MINFKCHSNGLCSFTKSVAVGWFQLSDAVDVDVVVFDSRSRRISLFPFQMQVHLNYM